MAYPPAAVGSQSLVGVPFDRRWEILKSRILHLYIDEDMSLPEVIAKIKTECGFDAKSDPSFKLA
jgi:hypothetical protein